MERNVQEYSGVICAEIERGAVLFARWRLTGLMQNLTDWGVVRGLARADRWYLLKYPPRSPLSSAPIAVPIAQDFLPPDAAYAALSVCANYSPLPAASITDRVLRAPLMTASRFTYYAKDLQALMHKQFNLASHENYRTLFQFQAYITPSHPLTEFTRPKIASPHSAGGWPGPAKSVALNLNLGRRPPPALGSRHATHPHPVLARSAAEVLGAAPS